MRKDTPNIQNDEYHGWKYCVNPQAKSLEEKMQVIPPVAIAKPRTFFKYYGLNDYNVEALTNGYVYASHPNQLNDLWDSNAYTIPIDTPAKAKKIWQEQYWIAHYLNTNNIEGFKRLSTTMYHTIAFKNLGIVSLSDSNDNPILWGTYATHGGFCVELDVDQIEGGRIGPFCMNYQKKLPKLNFNGSNDELCALMLSNIKLKCWEQEKEWRLLLCSLSHNASMEVIDELGERIIQYPVNTNRRFYYPREAVKSISLGNRFFVRSRVQNVTEQNTFEYVITDDKDKNKRKLMDYLSTAIEQKRDIRLYYKLNPQKFVQLRMEKLGFGHYLISEINDIH